MFKGWVGEKKTQFNLWVGLDSNLHQRFHHVISPSSHGTTQIDHILVFIRKFNVAFPHLQVELKES